SRSDVSHINVHATSTPVGDIAEYKALERVFGDAVRTRASRTRAASSSSRSAPTARSASTPSRAAGRRRPGRRSPSGCGSRRC
ncbi:hypothetical protein DOU12_15750, partial [Clavibacter michiganensis subsp. michiganensis]|nr:hypothetical protein [Clavibacter michiganensis subsp. michiganensis]